MKISQTKLSNLKKSTNVSAPRILVLSPTRELASQSHDVATELFQCNSNHQKLVSVCIYGGVPKHIQKTELKQTGLEIVVATPGRLLDLIEENAVCLSGIEYLVLDEADRMLDEGFEPAIRRIISFCPSNVTRQVRVY